MSDRDPRPVGLSPARSFETLHGWVLVVSLFVLAAINLLQFAAIDESIHVPRQAVGQHTSLRFAAVTAESARTARERYLVFAQLEELVPGASYRVEEGSGLRRQFLLGLARAAEVTILPGAPPVLPDSIAAALEEHVVAEGVLRGVGPYVIALPPGSPEGPLMGTARWEGRLVLAPEELLARLAGSDGADG